MGRDGPTDDGEQAAGYGCGGDEAQDDGAKKGVVVSTRKVVVVIAGYKHFIATYGTGDATIYVASFSGTIHLRKK